MKFSVYHKRVAIVALCECGKTAKQIYQTLKQLPVNERFVFRTLYGYRETDDVVDRPREERPNSARLPKVVHAVRERIRRCPLRINRSA